MMIKEMSLDDLGQVCQLEKELFPSSPWKKEDYLYELEKNVFAHYRVLTLNEKIIGYVGLWIIYEQMQITTLGVAKEYQSLGYGHQLLSYSIQEAKENGCEMISLEVRPSNERAMKLYESHGFKKVALRKNYYEDHEDAYLMVLNMKGDKDGNHFGN